jgi:DnaJ-class molecular chaperone with C-terminal Zn finger domain
MPQINLLYYGLGTEFACFYAFLNHLRIADKTLGTKSVQLSTIHRFHSRNFFQDLSQCLISHTSMSVSFPQPDQEPGDVIIVLEQKPHDRFQRQGINLVTTETITLTEALCGFTKVIKHLDDRQLLITHPPGEVIKPGKLNLPCSGRSGFDPQ